MGRLRHQVTSDERGRPIHWKEYQWGIDYRLHQIIDHTYKDRDVAFDYDDKGYLVRAIYNRKEEQFRTPDKLGNLYETKDKKDRKYKNSQLQQDRTYYYHYDVEGNLIFKEHIKDVGGNVSDVLLKFQHLYNQWNTKELPHYFSLSTIEKRVF